MLNSRIQTKCVYILCKHLIFYFDVQFPKKSLLNFVKAARKYHIFFIIHLLNLV